MVYNQFSPFKKKKNIILNYSQMSKKKPHKNNNFTLILLKQHLKQQGYIWSYSVYISQGYKIQKFLMHCTLESTSLLTT